MRERTWIKVDIITTRDSGRDPEFGTVSLISQHPGCVPLEVSEWIVNRGEATSRKGQTRAEQQAEQSQLIKKVAGLYCSNSRRPKRKPAESNEFCVQSVSSHRRDKLKVTRIRLQRTKDGRTTDRNRRDHALAGAGSPDTPPARPT